MDGEFDEEYQPEKKKRKNKPGAGRPNREFDKKLFENLCHINCTVDELESVLITDQRTLDVWCQREYGENFSTAYKRLCQNGKSSLRRYQFNQAKTNASMGIWLGKQYLGQKDNYTVSGDYKTEQTIVHYGSKEPKKWKTPKNEASVEEAPKASSTDT